MSLRGFTQTVTRLPIPLDAAPTSSTTGYSYLQQVEYDGTIYTNLGTASSPDWREDVHLNADGELVGPIIVRTGTASELDAVTLDAGEVTYVTDRGNLRVSDGDLAGGRPIGTGVVVRRTDGLSHWSYRDGSVNEANGTRLKNAIQDLLEVMASRVSGSATPHLLVRPVNIYIESGTYDFGSSGIVASSQDEVTAASFLRLIGVGRDDGPSVVITADEGVDLFDLSAGYTRTALSFMTLENIELKPTVSDVSNDGCAFVFYPRSSTSERPGLVLRNVELTTTNNSSEVMSGGLFRTATATGGTPPYDWKLWLWCYGTILTPSPDVYGQVYDTKHGDSDYECTIEAVLRDSEVHFGPMHSLLIDAKGSTVNMGSPFGEALFATPSCPRTVTGAVQGCDVSMIFDDLQADFRDCKITRMEADDNAAVSEISGLYWHCYSDSSGAFGGEDGTEEGDTVSGTFMHCFKSAGSFHSADVDFTAVVRGCYDSSYNLISRN